MCIRDSFKGIAECKNCLILLRNYFLSEQLTVKQKLQLSELLSKTNHPAFAVLLVDVIEKSVKTLGNTEFNIELTDKLKYFNSEKIARQFSNYLVSNQNTPMLLQDALINNINETSDRSKVALDIASQFNASNDPMVREKLLAINHPESLAQLHVQAIEQGNNELINRTLEQLKSNPSRFTLNTMLSLLHKSKLDPNENTQIVDAVHQLANRQLSGYRLDYIENQLAQGTYSNEDKLLVFDVLAHSEDVVRGAEIIAKFSPNAVDLPPAMQ